MTIDEVIIIDDNPLPFLEGFTQYQVTPQLSVETVVHINTAPEHWPVPTTVLGKVAYILDLCENPSDCIKNGMKQVDAFIKQEVSLISIVVKLIFLTLRVH